MSSAERTALSNILIGDLVTPHSPSEPFEYIASIVVIDGELRQVCLPDVLGGYPKDPGTVDLTPEQFETLRSAAGATETAAGLLASSDDDALMLSADFGVVNSRDYVAKHEPELLSDPALQEGDSAPEHTGFDETFALVVLVAIAVIVLLGLGAWVVTRAVSGF